jgi:methylenetetrahydrofolate dehydrogenase (NADP+)/methenyltetrahydrofolate cyclohydrolase
MYGKPVIDGVKSEVLAAVSQLKRHPHLVTLGISGNDEWQQYVSSLAKSAADYGCVVTNQTFSAADDFSTVKQRLLTLNEADSVDGILLMQPLPAVFKSLPLYLSPSKDIDGLTAANIHALYTNNENLAPATALAVVKMLEYYDIPLAGSNVTILGRGTAVGKPLVLLMLNRNATPTICHTKTRNIAEIARSADILICACGVAGMVNADFVTEKSVVVDVGLSFVDNKTRGDVNFDSVSPVVAALSPVPKGIGPLTRACLFSNLVTAATP